MAQKQKRPSPLDEPPTASSSDSEDDQQPSSQQQDEVEDDEEASSEEEEASSEEDEEEDRPSSAMQPASKNPPPPPTNSHPKPSSSESATESDSGSDTDSDPGPPARPTHANSKVKPIASKPMDQTPKPNKAQSSSTPARSATKRSAENNAHVTDPKRAKKKPADSTAAAGGSDDEMEEDGKKSGEDNKKLFQRLWSEEDEIAILKGIAEFTSKTGSDPLKYANAFHDFMKKSLHVDASSNQLKQKIRRLKKKFETNARKGKNGEDPTFSKPHEQKTFELSKKVWGNAVNEAAAEKVKSNGRPAKSPKKEGSSSRNAASAKKPKPEARPEQEEQPVDVKESGKMHIDEKPDKSVILSEIVRFEKGVGLCGLNEDVLKKGLELIEESKRAELEGRWKKLQVAELELFVKRAQLIEDQTRLILESYKSSNH